MSISFPLKGVRVSVRMDPVPSAGRLQTWPQRLIGWQAKRQQRPVSSSRSNRQGCCSEETSSLWMDESAARLGPSVTWFLLTAFSAALRVEQCWLHTLDSPFHGGVRVDEPGQGHTKGLSFGKLSRIYKNLKTVWSPPGSDASDGYQLHLCVFYTEISPETWSR